MRRRIKRAAAVELRTLLMARDAAEHTLRIAEAAATGYTRGLAVGMGINPETVRGLDDETNELLLADEPEG